MSQAFIIRIRADVDTKIAFDQWCAAYQKETGNPTLSQREAFRALLRKAGVDLSHAPVMPGQVFP